jgi:type IX secretion system PorP/SprF family membrane protein
MKQKLLVAICLLFLTLKSEAQQDPQYSHYMFNSLVINPAYAGYKQTLNLNALYRNQWAGVDGAPETQSIVVDGSFMKDKVGLGLSVVNDKAGLMGQLSAYLNYSYKIKMGEEGQLAFGLGTGLAQYSFNGDGATYEDPNDPNFSSGKLSHFSPDARFGIHYSTEKMYFGFSTTNMFSKVLNTKSNTENLIAIQGRHYFLTAGYLLPLNEFLKIKPSFLFKEDTKGPTSLDANIFFLLGEKVWLGGSYRSGLKLWEKKNLNASLANANAIVGMLEFMSKNWSIGYSYDYSISTLKGFSPSHEINLGIIMSRKKDIGILSPRYF